MKQLLLIGALLLSIRSLAQDNPIHWQFSAKKVSDKTYTIHLTATIDNGWHVYSQKQPEASVSQPTKIQFTENPLFTLTGKVKEVGDMEHWSVPESGLKANQYKNKVDFVQTITLKSNFSLKVTGNLTFQVCTDQNCLPPKTIPFSVAVP